MRRNGDINQRLDEVVELRAKPCTVNNLGVGGGGRAGRGRRQGGDDRGEEGLKREKRFNDVGRRRRRGDVGEKKREVVDVSS